MLAAHTTAPTANIAPYNRHPYTRNLIRWRGQHLAAATRLLERGELDWELARIPRYDRYDGRTTVKSAPSTSPRQVIVRSHHRAWIPPATTDPFTCGLHAIDITPGLLEEAIRHMRGEDLLEAFKAYIRNDFPPTVFRAHRRKGIVPSDEARFAGELRTAIGILGWLATRRELVQD